MKKIIMSLAFIAALVTTSTNADTLVNGGGVETYQCTSVGAPVTYLYASTNGGNRLNMTIGGKACFISDLSAERLTLTAAMLSEAMSSGRNAHVMTVLGNISVQLY